MSEPDFTPITGDVVEPPPAVAVPEDGVVVRNPAGWSLVQQGNWEVSIGPDHMVMLPRHLAPEEVGDFVAAITKAAELATELQAEVQATATSEAPSFSSTLVIQESGQPLPAGAVQLQPSSGSATASGSTVQRLDLSDPTADKAPTPSRPPATNV
jgi:hypothetical protein